jgi:hypothetical protein
VDVKNLGFPLYEVEGMLELLLLTLHVLIYLAYLWAQYFHLFK